jgi:hypothetical protein
MTDDEITAALHEAGLDSVQARAGGLDSERQQQTAYDCSLCSAAL